MNMTNDNKTTSSAEEYGKYVRKCKFEFGTINEKNVQKIIKSKQT